MELDERDPAVTNMDDLQLRINEVTAPILASPCSEKDRAIANLLKSVGGSLAESVRAGRRVGLMPYRVQTLLDILEADQGRRIDLKKD